MGRAAAARVEPVLGTRECGLGVAPFTPFFCVKSSDFEMLPPPKKKKPHCVVQTSNPEGHIGMHILFSGENFLAGPGESGEQYSLLLRKRKTPERTHGTVALLCGYLCASGITPFCPYTLERRK